MQNRIDWASCMHNNHRVTKTACSPVMCADWLVTLHCDWLCAARLLVLSLHAYCAFIQRVINWVGRGTEAHTYRLWSQDAMADDYWKLPRCTVLI